MNGSQWAAVLLRRVQFFVGAVGSVGVLGVLAGCAPGPAAGPPGAVDLGAPPSGNGCPEAASVDPRSPLAFGYQELEVAFAEARTAGVVCVTTTDQPEAQAALAQAEGKLDERAESFLALPRSGGGVLVVGRDAVGAMYGAEEMADRIRLDGPSALLLAEPIVRAPSVAIRAANLFLVMPEKGDAAWWFRDLGFWREYLDLLGRARMNFLDLHGMYNLDNTVFPNALLHFATSASLPDVGIPRAERDRNLATLNQVIELGRARGIRVGLMSYRSDESLDGEAVPPPHRLSEPQQQVYVREAAQDLATRAPGLWRLGFRIGESGHDAGWYNDTFIAGVKAAGTGVGIYTRTWVSDKTSVMKIVGAAGGDVIVEAKFNGEQLGLPYVVQGGTFTDESWTVYGYENYLEPPTPYSFVFQLRTGGTHRIFRHASFERVRRTVATTTLGGARGFTLEPTHAYFPQRDYYHAKAEDRFSPWTFRRDELTYLLFGRLGYDPTTPERSFQRALARRVGTDQLWSAVQAASEIVPWIQSGHTCGPDHRDFAAELELGGSVGYWASNKNSTPVAHSCGYYAHPGAPYHGPFDSFALASPFDTAVDLAAGRGTSRLSSVDVALLVLDAAARARAAASVAIDPANAEARDVVRECVALADLGEHFAHKLRAATLLAVAQRTGDGTWLDAARTETDLAHAAWKQLALDTAYILPFHDRLRMQPLGYGSYHWSKEVERLKNDVASIDEIAGELVAHPPLWNGMPLPDPGDFLDTPRDVGPGLSLLAIDPPDGKAPAWKVTAVLDTPPPDGASVNILWKQFSGLAQWHKVPASGTGTEYSAVLTGGGAGAQVAVEVVGGRGVGWRYPDVTTETPYLSLTP